MKKQVMGRSDLYKNTSTGVFNYINSPDKVKKLREAKAQREQQANDVQKLKQDVDEIKDILQQIMKKL